jgi:hypothetical protein
MSSNISNIIDSSEKNNTITIMSSDKLSKWKDDVKKDLQEIKNEIKDEINDTLSSLEHHITGAASERSPLLHKMKNKGKDATTTTSNNTSNNEGRSNSSPSKLSYTPKEEAEAAKEDTAAAAVVVTDDEEHIAAATPISMNTATAKSSDNKQKAPLNNSQGGITQLILIILLSTSTIYQTILHKLDIVSNSIPFIVAVHWCILTFFIGVSSSSSSSSSLRDGGMMDGEDVKGGGASSVVNQHYDQQERRVTFLSKQQEHQKRSSNTRDLIRRIPMGRRHYAKMKESLFHQKQLQRRDSPLLEEFFTNLKPAFKNITPRFSSGGSGSGGSDGGGEVTPLSEGMMIRLLRYSPDFGRRKSQMGEIDNSIRASCRRVQEEEEGGDRGSGSEEEEEVNYEMGTAPLGNIRASKLERDFGEVVVPMCKFRGMDFFVGDFPEKEIWKQPLLLK